MRKSSLVIVAGVSLVALSGASWAQGTTELGGSTANPSARSSALRGSATNSVKLNTPASELGFNRPMSASSLTNALGAERATVKVTNTNAKLGSDATPAGGGKLMTAPHSSSNLASALKVRGSAGAKSAALSEGGEPVDNKNGAALMGGNTLTGSGLPLKANGALVNTLK